MNQALSTIFGILFFIAVGTLVGVIYTNIYFQNYKICEDIAPPIEQCPFNHSKGAK